MKKLVTLTVARSRISLFSLAFLTTLFLISFSGSVFAQSLPLDFESGSYTFTDFDGGVATVVSNPASGGINTSSKVAKMVKGGGQVWAGSFITFASPIDFSTNKLFKIKVYMPRVGAKLLLKVENISDANINYQKEATGTVANQWEELSFDFSSIDASKQYSKMTFIFDNGTMGDGSANFTYYFDDVVLTMSTSTPPSLPLDFESGTISYSFTDFDGGATNVVANPNSSGINTSSKVAQMVKGGGQVWAGSWIELASPIDFSTKKLFKVKVYMPKVGAKLLLKVENSSNAAVNYEKEVAGTVANQWEELSFDFSGIDASKQYQKMTFIFDNGTMGDGTANFTYYFDDVELTEGTLPTGTQMDLPVTFDDSNVNYGLIGFGGAEASSIVADPNSSSNNVAKVIRSAGSETWAGTTISAKVNGVEVGFANKIPFTASATKMNVKVYAPAAGIHVRLKVEDYTDPTKSVETEAITTVANSWETLTFDFSHEATGTAALNLSYNYNKASIFFNFGVTGATAGEQTYYFDDIKFGDGATAVEGENQVPVNYSLSQNYPNPFNPSTVIRFSLPESNQVTLKVYDLLGREVATLINGYRNAGTYDVNFDASNLATGIYIYKISSGNFTSIKKMILLK